MKNSFIVLFAVLGLLSLSRCTNSSGTQFKSKALGRMNEVVVICDDDVWKSGIGDSIRYYYESAYPLLPAPEPLFDVRHYSVKDLETGPHRTELRTYLIVANLSDTTSSTTKMVRYDLGEERFNEALTDHGLKTTIGRNKWANGQVLMYVFGPDSSSIKSSIVKSFPTIAERIAKHDLKQLDASIYAVGGVNEGLSNDIANTYAINNRIPTSYVVVKNEQDTLLWLRRDSKEAIQNIVYFSEKYTDQKQLSKAYILDKLNSFGKNYVESTNSDSYLTIHERHLPVLEYDSVIDTTYAKELRGIWEMTEDFYGGPFIAYAQAKGDKVTYVLAFLLAINTDKRDYMKQMDHIIKNPK